jgi:hypothetical protein
MAFAEFMGSPMGRGLRVVFGAVLIYLGLNVIQGVGGTVVAVLGIVPIATGILNICILGPLLGAPMRPQPKTAPPKS